LPKLSPKVEDQRGTKKNGEECVRTPEQALQEHLWMELFQWPVLPGHVFE